MSANSTALQSQIHYLSKCAATYLWSDKIPPRGDRRLTVVQPPSVVRTELDQHSLNVEDNHEEKTYCADYHQDFASVVDVVEV